MAHSPELIWECVRANSSFIRKGPKDIKKGMPVMSAEPGNLTGLNSFKFSGLANRKVVGLSSKKDGKKESIVLTTKHNKKSRHSRPEAIFLEMGVNKEAKKGIAALEQAMGTKYCRRDLLD